VKTSHIFPAWGRILSGRRPLLSIEITKECPLRCPGCYAYEPGHLGGAGELRTLHDFRGDQLVDKVLALVRRYRPIHVSIVGGEPLVRYRELDVLLPKLALQNIEVQLVTSAVREIPAHWSRIEQLHLVVSIDGLQPEHDRRRAPATYERILRHIAGHSVIAHCTVTRQMLRREGDIARFADFWSANPAVRRIWFSLYTPQEGDCSEERLTCDDRVRAIAEFAQVRRDYPKVHMPDAVLHGFAAPPESPEDCIFSKVTHCFSADLTTRIEPCQFGGKPVCSECGCIASAGLASVANYKLGGLVRLGAIYEGSRKIGKWRNAAA
jgi:organic radical activating enzyme